MAKTFSLLSHQTGNGPGEEEEEFGRMDSAVEGGRAHMYAIRTTMLEEGTEQRVYGLFKHVGVMSVACPNLIHSRGGCGWSGKRHAVVLPI